MIKRTFEINNNKLCVSVRTYRYMSGHWDVYL